MELKNVSSHRPEGLVIDVPDEDAEEILDTGEFVKNTKEKLILAKKPKKKKEEFEVEEDLEEE